MQDFIFPLEIKVAMGIPYKGMEVFHGRTAKHVLFINGEFSIAMFGYQRGYIWMKNTMT